MDTDVTSILTQTPLLCDNAEQLSSLFMQFLTPETIGQANYHILQFLQQVYTSWNESPHVIATYQTLLRARVLFTAALAIHTDLGPSYSSHLYQLAEFVSEQGGVPVSATSRSGISVILAVYLHMHGLPRDKRPAHCEVALNNLLGLVRGHLRRLAQSDTTQASDAVATLFEIGMRPHIITRDCDIFPDSQLESLLRDQQPYPLTESTDLLLLASQALDLIPAQAAGSIGGTALRSMLEFACSPSLLSPSPEARTSLIIRALMTRSACQLAAVFPRDSAQGALMRTVERLQSVLHRDSGDPIAIPDDIDINGSIFSAEKCLYRVINILRTRPVKSIYSSVAHLLLTG